MSQKIQKSRGRGAGQGVRPGLDEVQIKAAFFFEKLPDHEDMFFGGFYYFWNIFTQKMVKSVNKLFLHSNLNNIGPK